jgi:hypothetical protein
MRELYNYVDAIIPCHVKFIDDYYDLDVRDLDENELSHLIDKAVKHDARLRDHILGTLQMLIDERLCDYKSYIDSGEYTADDLT